jgi:cation/acetate symporter
LVALLAAYVAAQRPADILYLVAASFSLAGAAFVPAMIFGIFWPGTTRGGAVAGMLAGLGLTLFYMAINSPALRALLGLHGSGLWFEIEPVAAGVFGVSAGVLVTLAVSLLTRTSGRPVSP